MERTATVTGLVDNLRSAPERRDELVVLLAEQGPVYDGLGTREAQRLRGYVLASFEAVGLPPAALPFVLEELETGLEPYTVAAAAKALRGASEVPDAVVPLLLNAARRIASNDDYVRYDIFAPGDAPPPRTTALVEILRTVTALGPHASVLGPDLESLTLGSNSFAPDVLAALDQARCAVAAPTARPCCCSGAKAPPPTGIEAVYNILLEDQGGRTFTFDAFFGGRLGVLTFFYTRCMNPEKCSLTITKLARLQRLLRTADLHGIVSVAAITYDPAYDRADRLHAYGLDRGMRFDARNKLLRTVGPFEPIRALFDLGVGFGPATVNGHRVELLLLDASGQVRTAFTRVQWREDDILKELLDALPRP